MAYWERWLLVMAGVFAGAYGGLQVKKYRDQAETCQQELDSMKLMEALWK